MVYPVYAEIAVDKFDNKAYSLIYLNSCLFGVI